MTHLIIFPQEITPPQTMRPRAGASMREWKAYWKASGIEEGRRKARAEYIVASRQEAYRAQCLAEAAERARIKAEQDRQREMEAIRDRAALMKECPNAPPSLILKEVSFAYGVSVDTIHSDRRDALSVRARHVAMYLCRRITTKSSTAIGHAIGLRDHTSVLNGIKRIEKLVRSDPAVASSVADIEARIIDRMSRGSRLSSGETRAKT